MLLPVCSAINWSAIRTSTPLNQKLKRSSTSFVSLGISYAGRMLAGGMSGSGVTSCASCPNGIPSNGTGGITKSTALAIATFAESTNRAITKTMEKRVGLNESSPQIVLDLFREQKPAYLDG